MVVVPSICRRMVAGHLLVPAASGEGRECARVVGGRDVLSSGSLCVLSTRAVGSVGWGSPVAWRGSVVVVKPSNSEVGSSACTPLLSSQSTKLCRPVRSEATQMLRVSASSFLASL